jgi:hypothetical protein
LLSFNLFRFSICTFPRLSPLPIHPRLVLSFSSVPFSPA